MIPEGRGVGSQLTLAFPGGPTMVGTIAALATDLVTVTYASDPYTGTSGSVSIVFSLPIFEGVTIS